MVKSELIAKVVENLAVGEVKMSKKDVELVLKAVGEVTKDALVDGEEVPVVGLGKVKTKNVAERESQADPRDKSKGRITVPAHKAPKFVFSKDVKEAVK